MVSRVVTAFYNLGVLLIATGTFKSGIDFTVGVGIGLYMMILGFLIDLFSEGGKDE